MPQCPVIDAPHYICPMRLGVLDNIDSFTYNLVHRLAPMVDEIIVCRNDDPQAIDQLNSCDAIVLSPGPGLPVEAGCMMEGLKVWQQPILGVCLGMQAIAIHHGGQLQHLDDVRHGRQRHITQVDNSQILRGLHLPIEIGLYHSWAVAPDLPDHLRPTSWSEEGTIMSIEHTELPHTGIQCHPESVMTPQGDHILSNWIELANR